MEAGPELDVLVAEHVIGFCGYCRDTARIHDGFEGNAAVVQDDGTWRCARHDRPVWPQSVPAYSTDIAAAWQVVERLVPSRFRKINISVEDDWWMCEFGGGGESYAQAGAYGFPLAISIAALRAVGVEPTRILAH